ncbi:cytochrome P450 CYP9A22 isoform X1 [Bombyx mori]|uniref:unspecific monooxygenase n=1 Tax=Bombyx mori TaxID=7091 RepID=A4ZWB1_BOMMO|nr:cytochrome P450 CYP9A22 isoform X1 [Bombyx mori]ABP65279.1 cytochrome P450 [Bombyx mori]BAM73893.1 cytochrome P450 [Bombyx mori]
MITLIWLGVLLVTLTLHLRKVYSRFKDYGVNHFTPIPVLGNAGPITVRLRHVAEDFDMVYKAFPEDRFTGRFDLLRPTVIIKDLDLIKQITIKDFEHFLDHRALVDDTADPFFGRNLFSLRGQEWKDMRSTLSPAFTSSKMRGMVPFMVEVNNQMIDMIKKKIVANADGYLDCEGKDLTTRYANDVIASCAFGVKVDSHTNEENQFYLMGRDMADFGFRKIMVFLGYSSFPKLMKKFNAKLLSDETGHFFTDLVLRTMEDREVKEIVRPDMIHLLMEAKQGKLSYDEKSTKEADTGFATVEESDVGKKTINRIWSNTDLIAQATLFFVAGFETISSAMSFALHELALNPEIQDRLVQEIKENYAKTGGKFDFNCIQDLTYMDMFVSEVLRLWTPVVGMDRLCVKDYNLGRANKNATKDFILRKGEGLSIPTWSIHHNPEYYPEPYKFDPERFSEENKRNIKPFTYLPFGTGPRNCIGSRFALCEVKVMLYQLLQQIEVLPSDKTKVRAKLAKDTFNVKIEGGHWIRLKLRD